MARVTVEDCLENMENRFELIMVASRRARQLARGYEAHLPWENDKPTVMALREIAEGHVDARILDEIEEQETITAAEQEAERARELEVQAALADTVAPEAGDASPGVPDGPVSDEDE